MPARRRVYQVGAAYLVSALAMWEGASFAFPRLGLADWALDVLFGITLAGLPVALVLAWVRGRDEVEGADPEAAPPRSRVAVLPFANISADRGDEYFADGMTEELISVASRIQGLDVIARTSVMQYKEAAKGISQIGRELGVGTVLEGSVRKAGERLRITVQLVDCVSEGHLWAEDYDRELADVFAIQRDIARRVAGALQVRLLTSDEEEIAKTPTDDLEAYDLYLLGRYHLNRRNDDGLRRAVEYFRKVIALDPDSASAHAGLSEALALSGIGYSLDPPPDALRNAVTSARRAIEIDPSDGKGYTALALASMHSFDFETAEEAVRKALELQPGAAETHQWAAWLLFRGRFEEAIAVQDRALELDPRSVALVTESGWPYLYMGRHEEALARFDRALEIDPDYALAHYNVACAFHNQGRLDEAIGEYERALELGGDIPFMRVFLAKALREIGRVAEADAIVADLERIHREGGPPVATLMAFYLEARGEKDEAIDWLEKALADREPIMAWAGHTGEYMGFSSLWGDERFEALMAQVGAVGPRS